MVLFPVLAGPVISSAMGGSGAFGNVYGVIRVKGLLSEMVLCIVILV
jgi:hypothetical protein